jgi:DNA-directed RNA polymerase alpha subunit
MPRGVEAFVNHRDCNCTNHCPKCSVTFTLQVKNTEKDVLIVYSSDLVSSNDHVHAVNYSSEEEVQIETEQSAKGSFISHCFPTLYRILRI